MTARQEELRQSDRSATESLAQTLAEDRKSAARIQQETVQILKAPRMDCSAFHGKDEEDYEAWKTSFIQVYPATLLPKERFLGLKQKTAGAAKEVLSSLATADSSFAEAFRRLDEKYGRPDQIIARLNRRFKAEAAVYKMDDPRPLRSLFEKIRAMVFSYRQLGEPMAGSFLIEAWLEKLPKQVARKWAKATLQDYKAVEDVVDDDGNVITAGNGLVKKGGNVDAFLELVEDEVRTVEILAALTKGQSYGKDQSRSQNDKGNSGSGRRGGNSASLLTAQGAAAQGQGQPQQQQGQAMAYAAAAAKPPAPAASQAAGSSGQAEGQGAGKPKREGKKAQVTCADCAQGTKGHEMATCKKFLAQAVSERRRWVWDLFRCKRCLRKGHLFKKCREPVLCTDSTCQNRESHHPHLHSTPR